MTDLQTLYQNGAISEMDYYFARLMARCQGEEDPIVTAAAALVSCATSQGHVCLDLTRMEILYEMVPEGMEALVRPIHLSQWMDALADAVVVGRPGQFKPLILDGTRLYLHRLWHYEQAVAKGILDRCRTDSRMEDPPLGTPQALADAFPEGDPQQRLAVQSALTRRFTVIAGGPGTGKTYTIARLILLLQQRLGQTPLRLKLAAPTGKAAMRLQTTIEAALANMGHETGKHPLVEEGVQTLHRLLGAMAGQSGFRYNKERQLPVDMVIVDEASMIDLALMAALMAALPPSARLVLIGDKNQLASVEAGAVLGDICSGVDRSSAPKQKQPKDISHHIIVLNQRYRFSTQSGIDALASAVNAGDPTSALSLLNDSRHGDVHFKIIHNSRQLEAALNTLVPQALLPNFSTTDPRGAFDRMAHLMILSPLRNGPFGVVRLNAYIEQVLTAQGAIAWLRTTGDRWYAGRPVMITRNDYYHHLFNGDVGITLATETKGRASPLKVFFPDGRGGLKPLTPHQLPPHETAYAMTVHKSQGSEFEKVVLVLPDQATPVLSRELIYTAVTRARRSVEIWGTEHCLQQAIQQPVKRNTGLMQLLWPNANK